MPDSETPVEQHLPRSLWMEADLLLDVDQDTSYCLHTFWRIQLPVWIWYFVDTKAGEWIINNPLVIRISEQVGHNTAEQGAAANP